MQACNSEVSWFRSTVNCNFLLLFMSLSCTRSHLRCCLWCSPPGSLTGTRNYLCPNHRIIFPLRNAVCDFFHRPPIEPLLSSFFPHNHVWELFLHPNHVVKPFVDLLPCLLSNTSHDVTSFKTTADKFFFSYSVFLGCPKDYYNLQ